MVLGFVFIDVAEIVDAEINDDSVARAGVGLEDGVDLRYGGADEPIVAHAVLGDTIGEAGSGAHANGARIADVDNIAVGDGGEDFGGGGEGGVFAGFLAVVGLDVGIVLGLRTRTVFHAHVAKIGAAIAVDGRIAAFHGIYVSAL